MPTNRTRVRRVRRDKNNLCCWDAYYLLLGTTMVNPPPEPFEIELIPDKWQRHKQWILKWQKTGELPDGLDPSVSWVFETFEEKPERGIWATKNL